MFFFLLYTQLKTKHSNPEVSYNIEQGLCRPRQKITTFTQELWPASFPRLYAILKNANGTEY